MMQNTPGDSRMIDKIVHQLKSQGIFDQFRKECIADVDTKPAYQNLHQRVEGSVSGFLASQVWRPDLNKNQLRDSLRKHIHESGFLDIGVERIVDQVVNPKILTVFMPQVEDVVYRYLGIEKPKKGKENQTVYATPSAAENVTRKEEKKLPTLTDLLPKELEPISPESDTLKDEEYNSDEDLEVGFPSGKEEEESSPPFEPIEEVNSRLGESSMDSHLSGISELTSHDSQHSHASFLVSNSADNDSSPPKLSTLDISNNDSQLSRVSSGSRLSIVSGCEQDCRLSHDIEGSNDSQQSKTSLLVSGQGTQMSVSMEFTHEENEVKDGECYVAMDIASEESSIYANIWQTSVQNNIQNVSDEVTANKNPKREASNQEEQRLFERSEKEVGNEWEKKCEDETKLTAEYENKSEIFGHKFVENEDIILLDKFENKLDDDKKKKTDEKLEEKYERKIDEKTERTDQSDKKAEVQGELKLEDVFVKEESGKCERMPDEKHGKKSDENLDKKLDDRCESKSVENFEIRFAERSEHKSNDKCERKLGDKLDRKLDEKSARKLDEKYEKSDDSHEGKLVEKPEKEFDEKSDVNSDEKSEQILDEKTERKSDHKSEKKSDEKLERKLVEKPEKKYDERSERKVVEKCERRSVEKSEKKLNEKFDRKLVEKLEKRIDEKSERKYDEKPEQKLDERSEKKSDDKSEKKSDEIFEKKSDDKAEKRLADKSEKKLDLKVEKKTDSRSEKKVEDKHDKKQDKHREDREKFREKKGEKKQLGSESRDLRKNDIGGNSSVGEKKRSEKDKHKKERGDSRSRAEKSIKDGKEKTEKAGSKDKLQREEKSEKGVMKEKCEQEVKEIKDEKEKDASKDKSKKDGGNILRHDKGSKKSKSDEKRQRDGKEKPKSEEMVRMKHDDKRKDRTKFESRDKSDKDKSVHHGYKNSKDGNRSDSKESKDRMKQEAKDKGKGTASKSEEKKSKDKSKREEKTSKIADKGSVKKGDKKNTEMKSSKLSHTNHKNKDSGKKDKENKGKTVTDDHRIHRDKRSDDRRSTDRDSNGTARDRPVGSTSSRTNVNDSQRTQSHRDKSGSKSNSTKSDSGGNSDSSGANTLSMESFKNIDNIFSSSKSASPPSSLPFKKRPVAMQSEDEYESTHSGSGKLTRNKIKKPKIAANIFEVKKIMMLRKSLAKKERKQQRELKKKNIRGVKEIKSGKKMTKPSVAKRKKLGDVEKSLRNEVDTSLSNKHMPDVQKEGEDSEGLKYFDPELFPSSLSSADSDFLAYVKELLKSENLSEISISDSGSEESDVGDIIHLPSFYLDNIVATELGAKLVKTDKGTEVLLDLPEEKELSKKTLPSLNSSMKDCLPVANKGFTAVGSCKITASPGEPIVLTDQCEHKMSHNTEERTNVRSVSALSTSSHTSGDILSDRKAKRILRQRSSSVTSTNSNKSTSDRTEVASNGLGVGKVQHSGPKLHRKREFLKGRGKTVSVCETKTPEVMVEKRGFRRSHRPSAHYSNKIFSSYMEDEDLSHDAFSEERENIILDDEFSLITHNDISKSVPDRASRLSPILSGQNKIFLTRMKIPATITQADDDSSDREIVSEASAGDPYDIIKDNNNIDKGSSEDERGCGDGSMLNQDLILPTLRDLMVESGFRRQDDNSNILSSLSGVENSVGNSLQVTGSNVGSVRGVHEAKKGAETRRPKLGRSRRVGLGRPLAKKLSEQAGGYDTGNRTPPSSNMADFVMPLSPESDISASSGEAKKPVLDPKVGDNYTDPSPSSSDKDGQMSNSRLGNTEIRRSLRSGGIGTPGVRAQRYNSDDLYKPRPLFSQCSRRVRGQVSPSHSPETVTNCTSKRRASDVTETHSASTKRRR